MVAPININKFNQNTVHFGSNKKDKNISPSKYDTLARSNRAYSNSFDSGITKKINDICEFIERRRLEAQEQKQIMQEHINSIVASYLEDLDIANNQLNCAIEEYKKQNTNFDLYSAMVTTYNPLYFRQDAPRYVKNAFEKKMIVYYQTKPFSTLYSDPCINTNTPKAVLFSPKIDRAKNIRVADCLYDFENSAVFSGLKIYPKGIKADEVHILDEKKTNLSFARFAKRIADGVSFSSLRYDGDSQISAYAMVTYKKDGADFVSAKVYINPLIKQYDFDRDDPDSIPNCYISADKVYEFKKDNSSDDGKLKLTSFMNNVEEKITGIRHKITAGDAINGFDCLNNNCKLYLSYSSNDKDGRSDVRYKTRKSIKI